MNKRFFRPNLSCHMPMLEYIENVVKLVHNLPSVVFYQNGVCDTELWSTDEVIPLHR